jgi:hypothetical protein
MYTAGQLTIPQPLQYICTLLGEGPLHRCTGPSSVGGIRSRPPAPAQPHPISRRRVVGRLVEPEARSKK